MKTLISIIALCFTTSAWALPVLNQNTPGADNVTVFPDHQDKNLYYLAPTVVVVSKSGEGAPNFSYMEFRPHWFTMHAVIQTTLRPDFTYEGIERARKTILALNKNARFTALPFDKSSMEFTNSLRPLVVVSDCEHRAGTVADEQTCAFEINSKGISVLRPMLKQGLAITAQYVYEVQGVKQNANGSFENGVNTYQVAARIGGAELAKHPELFRDAAGNVIQAFAPMAWELEE